MNLSSKLFPCLFILLTACAAEQTPVTRFPTDVQLAAPLVAGQQQNYTLTVTDSHSNPVQLQPFSDGPLRLIAVSADLSEFHDLQPQRLGNSLGGVIQLTTPGTHTLFAQMQPQGYPLAVEMIKIQIPGITMATPAEADLNLTQRMGDIQASLTLPDQITLQQPARLQFKVIAPTGVTAQFKRLVVIKTAEELQTSHFIPAEITADRTPREAVFETTFRQSGYHKLWLILSVSDTSVTVPFIIKIPEARP